MSNAVSARIERLNMPLLRVAERHGRRLDEASAMRKVRDAESLTWVPDGVDGDPLALADRLAEHVAGVFVPKSKTQALHMLVKVPDSVPTRTEEEARAALDLCVAFAQDVFGGQAVFAARIDRDERSTNAVDLFLAPVYQKVTKREAKPAVSMTRHLKLLMEEHGRTPSARPAVGEDDAERPPSARDLMRGQGQALQDALAAWLRARGIEAERGKAKPGRASDWRTPEQIGAQHDREAAEAARAETVALIATELRDVRSARAVVDADRAAVAAERRDVDRDRRAVDDDRRAVDADRVQLDRGRADLVLRSRAVVAGTAALEKRAADLDQRERTVREQGVVLGGLIDRLGPVVKALTTALDRVRKAPADVRRWLDGTGADALSVDGARGIMAQARAAIEAIGTSEAPAAPAKGGSGVEEPGLAVQEALRARMRGQGL